MPFWGYTLCVRGGKLSCSWTEQWPPNLVQLQPEQHVWSQPEKPLWFLGFSNLGHPGASVTISKSGGWVHEAECTRELWLHWYGTSTVGLTPDKLLHVGWKGIVFHLSWDRLHMSAPKGLSWWMWDRYIAVTQLYLIIGTSVAVWCLCNCGYNFFSCLFCPCLVLLPMPCR